MLAWVLVAASALGSAPEAAQIAPEHHWVAKRAGGKATPAASADMGMDLTDVTADTTGGLAAVALDSAGVALRGQLSVSGGKSGAEHLFTLSPRLETRLPVGKYLAVASVPGRLAQGRAFQVTADGKATLEFHLAAAPDSPRASLTRRQIHLEEPVAFRPGAAQIARRSLPVLDEVVDVLLTSPQVKLHIEARTDEGEDADDRMSLAHERAKEVMRYLTERGVRASRLTALGYAIDGANAGAPNDEELLRRLVLEIATDD
jgi:outer membrane protein OmpA-like peptidoglycan-associated protein